MAANVSDFEEHLFVKGKWIISVQDNEQTKIAPCKHDETFNKTHSVWQVLPKNSTNNEDNTTTDQQTRKYIPPFDKIVQEKAHFHVGCYLIRDLLNMEKFNDLSKTFIVNGIPLNRVIVCARIMSVEVKNQHYRLVINDGTSSILCIIKVNDLSAPNSFKNKAMQFGIRSHAEEPHFFDNSSLGKAIKVIGNLKEYMKKNFIFACHIHWISEQGFVDFMEYVISLYALKRNVALE